MRRVFGAVKWMFRAGFRLGLFFFIFSVYQVLFYRFLDPWTTPKIVSNWVENVVYQGDWTFPEYQWANFEEVSPYVFLAVMTAEDQKFLQHHGFDLEAIEKAFKNNKRGKRIKGASTISQQVSKNMFLWPGRNFVRKGLEAYYTVLIELIWPKKRILEMYVNIVELGPNVYSIQQASEKYFKKPAAQLTKEQAALVASVLPNPVRYKIAQPSAYVLRRKNWVLSQMRYVGNKKMIENL